MEIVGLLVVLVIGLASGIWLAVNYGLHSSDREQALLAQLDALQAVNRLSLATWQARGAMLEEAKRQAGRG